MIQYNIEDKQLNKCTYWGNWNKVETERVCAEEGGDKIYERWVLFISPCGAHHTNPTTSCSNKTNIIASH
jgi:hypothetical protein